MSAPPGQPPRIFAIMEAAAKDPASVHMELEGVTCTVCHQIKPDNFGKRDSFDGGYLIDPEPVVRPGRSMVLIRSMSGRQRVMHSSTGEFVPTESMHIRQSELCATCHTLYTTTLDSAGKAVGELPGADALRGMATECLCVEQESCQNCHMPVDRRARAGQRNAGPTARRRIAARVRRW